MLAQQLGDFVHIYDKVKIFDVLFQQLVIVMEFDNLLISNNLDTIINDTTLITSLLQRLAKFATSIHASCWVTTLSSEIEQVFVF